MRRCSIFFLTQKKRIALITEIPILKKSIFDTCMVKIVVFSEGNVWLSGSKQGWQPRGRWFKSSWGQSVFVGGKVRLGYVRLEFFIISFNI